MLLRSCTCTSAASQCESGGADPEPQYAIETSSTAPGLIELVAFIPAVATVRFIDLARLGFDFQPW